MNWSRERDYHGYKSYAEDTGRQRAGGGVLAGLIGALKAVLGVVAKPTPSPVNLSKGARGYSTLGSRGGLQPSADSPFPTASAETASARLNDNSQCTR
jgi:hypothetical protein